MASVEPMAMRIMLATDDSDAARTAEGWIARLRYADPPTIDVVCVAGRGLARLGWAMQTYREPVRLAVEGIQQGELYAAERIANDAGERLQDAGMHVRTWARQGDPATELLEMAATDRFDLIVAGPRGRSGLAAAILGSVTHALIAHATRPVLVARPVHADHGSLPEHILLVVDDRQAAETCARWLVRSGWLSGARLTMLGLLGDRSGLESAQPVMGEEVSRLVRLDASQALDVLAQRFAGRGAELDLVLRDGHPLVTTLKAAEELGADVVAVARPPRGPGRDPLAEKIARHARVSALLVPHA